VVTAVSRAWLYLRSDESVRIVVDGGHVAVYGPGLHFSHSHFSDEMDAVLHHAMLEEALIRDGWILEDLTTERRLNGDRRAKSRPMPDRRRSGLRLVWTS
jgi:hypothetical protein